MSYYDLFTDKGQVMSQRFVDYFSGSSLDSRWTTTNVNGTNTFTMSDSVDGGFAITSGTSNGNRGMINFNDKRQYAFNSSVLIAIVTRITATNAMAIVGFANTGLIQPTLNAAWLGNETSQTFYRLVTSEGSTQTASNTDIPVDTTTRSIKIECGSTNIKLTIDGVEKVDKTTDRPAAKLQPFFYSRTLTTAAAESRIRYLEAYNT